MSKYSSWLRKISVLLMALAIMIAYSAAPMNQSYAASKKPAKVTVSSLKAVSSSSVKVTWKKASNAKKYEVYVSTKSKKGFKRVATLSSSTRSYTVKKYNKKALKAYTKYYVKVRAVNGKKKGSFSKTKSVKTKKKPAAVKTNTVYVTPAWLNSALAGQQSGYSKVVVCEVSYGKPADSYAKGHVPGAINVFSTEVEDATGEPGQYKAYNLLSVDEIRANLIAKGITADTKVVLYDAFGDPCEVGRQAYGYLVAGVKDVKILNGDLAAWKKAGFSTETKKNTRKAVSSFGDAPAHLEYWTSIEDAKAKLESDPSFKLVSIRSEQEWFGYTSGYSYMNKAGEPKGAVWGKGAKSAADVKDFINEDGTVMKLDGFKEIWKDCKFKTDDSEHLAFYCGTGWRATVPFLVLYENGYKNISVYDGGWYEWIMDDSNPVQVGDPEFQTVKYSTVGELPNEFADPVEKEPTLGATKETTMTIDIDMTDTERYPANNEIELWVPVPCGEDCEPYQTVSNFAIKADKAAVAEFTFEENTGWHNQMAHIKWNKKTAPADRTATISFDVKRYAVSRAGNEVADAGIPTDVRPFIWLKSSRVNPTDPIVQKYAAIAAGGAETTLGKAENIYNWIIDNLERLDIGDDLGNVVFSNDTGCGKGDPADLLTNFEKYGRWGGHCTDLNSCFVALCRANGIPAREMFGIRLNETSSDGQHCWAEFYLPGEGWTFADPGDVLKEARAQAANRSQEAIDAARKTDSVLAKKKALWLGVDNNRVVLNRGRDVVLEPAQKGEPRNTFGYPYAEMNGVQKDAKGEVIDCTKYKDFKYTVTCTKVEAVDFNTISDEEWAKYGINYSDITAEDFILDVRQQANYDAGHLPGATSADVTVDGYEAKLDEAFSAAGGKRIVIICNAGKTLARRAMQYFNAAGKDMTKITYLIGGNGSIPAEDKVVDFTTMGEDAWATYGIEYSAITEADFILDVRQKANYDAGHLPGATPADVTVDGYETKLEEAFTAAGEKRIVIICNAGKTLARRAMQYFNAAGKDMTKITYLIGGNGSIPAEDKVTD